MTENQDEIQRLSFPGLTPITTDNDGDPALLDNIPGRQAGTPLKELLFNPLIKKVNQLVKAANDGITNIKGYLPLTGGKLSGLLEVPDFVENQDPASVLNMKSSDSRYQKAGNYQPAGNYVCQNDPSFPVDKSGNIGIQWFGYRPADGTLRINVKDNKGGDLYYPYIGVPIGSIVMISSWNIPEGWLQLAGQKYDRNTFPTLFKMMGTDTLPDYRGRFPRGCGGSWIGVPDIGSYQGDTIRELRGTFSTAAGQWGYGATGIQGSDGIFNVYNSSTTPMTFGGGDHRVVEAHYDFYASRVVPTDWENRPLSVVSNFIIKAI